MNSHARNRVAADCRKFGGDCGIRISGSEAEVLPLAVYHAVNRHQHEDTPEFREQVRQMLEPSSD